MEKKKKNRKTPWSIYMNLRKKENRVQFWAISISVFVCFFTIWMGLTYKSIIIDNNDMDKVFHTKIVSKRLFYKEKLLSICDSILIESLYINASDGLSEIDAKVKQRYVDNWESFLNIADSVIRISDEAKYYLEKEDYDSISFNNQKLSMLIPHIRNIFQKRSDVLSEIHTNTAFYGIKYYIEQNSLDKSADHHNLSAFFPFVDTLNADIRKYNESKAKCEELKRKVRVYEDLASRYDSTEIIASGIKDKLDSLQYFKKQFEIIPDYTLGLIIYKNIVSVIMDNYCVIATSVEPRKDFEDIWKKINFSNNLKLVLISLFSFIVIAFVIWYILVSIIFKNTNDFLTVNKYGWKNTKELEEAIERNKKYLRDLKEK